MPGSVVDADISEGTLRRLAHDAGGLASACVAEMETTLPWFASLPADARASVRLVTQAGLRNFVAWLREYASAESTQLREPGATIRLSADAFRTAPRELTRRLTLRRTVELVRVATDVFERHLPTHAADPDERRALTEAVLRFCREIAFAAASVYADAAENRGAWDARLEALVVDAVVRGEADDAMLSRASALGFDPARAVRVVVGSPADDEPEELLRTLRRQAARAGRTVLVGMQGNRMVVLLSERTTRPTGDVAEVLGRLVDGFGPGAVVVGPSAPDLAAAGVSAREALAGLRAAPARPDAPRPVASDDLLPERALRGDRSAHQALVDAVVVPVTAAGGELLRTLTVFLDGGAALEACARALYVHPNTVRYRLRRVRELTGYTPGHPRDALVLRTALMVARMDLRAAERDPARE